LEAEDSQTGRRDSRLAIYVVSAIGRRVITRQLKSSKSGRTRLRKAIPMRVRVLTGKEVLAACKMRDCIEEMRRAFLLRGRGMVESPLRARIAVTERRNILVMPSLIRNQRNDVSLKVVSIYPDLGKGKPTLSAATLLVDGRDGTVRAIVEGASLTAMRTGAVSGLSCRYLARRDSKVLGVIGAGAQAFQQVSAVSSELGIEQVRVHSKHGINSRKLAKRCGRELHIAATAVDRVERCVKGCDVIVTATTSKVPLFDGKLVEQGTHVIAIGAYTPDSREVDSAFVARASVYVDSVDACLEEAGELLIPIREGVITKDAIRGELADLVASKDPGRTREDEITFFKSVGLAFEDTAAGWMAYREAEKAGLGRTVEL
jgi:ornithine cyclodeaminase/alanine dehydrogenase-like protein (mu-crystallin family)